MPTKLFVGISSCQRYEDNGWNDALRETWLQDAKELGISHKFFHGHGATPKEDVVIVNAYDDYHSLFHKTLEKFRWVYEQGFDTFFHCYHDTYACAERLLQEQSVADYHGDYLHADPRQPWPHFSHGVSCQAGQGVFMSRRALKCVIDDMPGVIAQHPEVWEEDYWSGKIINRYPDLTIVDTRQMPCNLAVDDPGPRTNNKIISVHLSTIHDPFFKGEGARESEAKYRPEYMYKMHREWKQCPPESISEITPTVEEPSISSIPVTYVSSDGPRRTLRRLQ